MGCRPREARSHPNTGRILGFGTQLVETTPTYARDPLKLAAVCTFKARSCDRLPVSYGKQETPITKTHHSLLLWQRTQRRNTAAHHEHLSSFLANLHRPGFSPSSSEPQPIWHVGNISTRKLSSRSRLATIAFTFSTPPTVMPALSFLRRPFSSSCSSSGFRV